VGGIGEQRERGDDDPDRHLRRHKRHDQSERELQCAGFARVRRAVSVVLMRWSDGRAVLSSTTGRRAFARRARSYLPCA
jgi:hypothetical protein